MKKSLLIQSSWAVAVVAAFAIGSRRAGNSSPAPSAAGLSAAVSQTPNSSGPLSRKVSDSADFRSDSAIASALGTSISKSTSWNDLLQQALRDRNPIARRLAFSRLLEQLTPTNAGSIREQMVALGAEPDQWRDFHYSWGAIDGKAAFANAAKSPEDDLGPTMSGWAAANPAEALNLLDNLPPEMAGQREALTASVVSGLAHNDLDRASAYVMGLSQNGNAKAGELMETVAVASIRQLGPEAASRWAGALEDGPIKGYAMARVAESYVRRDPEAAARWTEGFAHQEYAARTIQQVGSRWAESNPAAAVGWLETLPESSGQKQGLNGAFSDWEDRDPVAAGDYLFAMAKSPQRDAAISGFAAGYAWQDPQTAIAWAKDIGDPVLRESSLTRAGRAFHRRDPAGAAVWLPQSGLSEAAQQAVLSPERRR